MDNRKKKPEKKKLPEVLALKTVRGGLCDCARNEMLYRGIRCGEPLICTDPKGKLYSMTYKMAKEHNYIVREFNLNQPILSDGCDFMKRNTSKGKNSNR